MIDDKMEADPRNIIKALIVDKNIPREAARQILKLILENWSDDKNNILQACWKSLSQMDPWQFLFKGPRISLQQSRIRVSRFVTLRYLFELGYIDLPVNDPIPNKLKPISWEKLLSSKKIICVTLDEEIRDLKPDSIRDQLGNANSGGGLSGATLARPSLPRWNWNRMKA